MDANTQTLVDLLRTIHTRPKMYFWGTLEEPFKALVNFITGYRCALPGYHDATLSMCGGSFHQWLLEEKKAKRLVGDPNVGWPGMISRSYPNEQERFEAFFSLLDEYLGILRG